MGETGDLLETGVHSLPNASQWIRAILRYRSEHPALRRVLDVIARLQDHPFRTNAVLLGEAGTGKEGLARALHALMHTSAPDAPFVEASLGGRDGRDVLAELCGHGDVPGLFEQAAGGTLYLDEVATLPREVQARVLGAIRGRTRRRGAAYDRAVDITVFASSDHDLEREVAAGRLRHDLYWRLSRVVLHLPPLRERREDIARLAIWIGNRILQRYEIGGSVALEGDEDAEPGSVVLTRDACDALTVYDWPGNFRELDAVVERALMLYRTGARVDRTHIAAALARPQAGR